jgi:hypothetical protein
MQPVDLIGILGGLAGLVALIVQGYILWQKRKPDLRLFVPYHFSADRPDSDGRLLFCLIRISNLSERPAFIYFETVKAEILYRKCWHTASVPNFPEDSKFTFDLPEQTQHHAGVKQFKFFNKFSNNVISLDNPYSRYFALTYPDRNIIENAEKLRLAFKDCNLKKHVLEAEILKNDPSF